jgi:hypothetical protein
MLGKEDIDMYTLWLLLEYARLCGDNREQLGIVGDLVNDTSDVRLIRSTASTEVHLTQRVSESSMSYVVPGSRRRGAGECARACAAMYALRMSGSGGTRSKSCEACVYEPCVDAVAPLFAMSRRRDRLGILTGSGSHVL